ncbi:MAG: elongation factor P [Candidatus Saganbacteria bacterium]|nr:elongation factor P [Candidatus Saganbacteria bacterium]
MALGVTELRPGVTFEMKGQLYKTIEYNHIKWAQQARVKIRMKNLRNGAITEQTFNVGEMVEPARIEYKQMQFLYSDGDFFHFMDQTTFEQVALEVKKIGDYVKYIREGATATVLFFGEEALDVEIPMAVELKVTETPPGVKGDTVSGGKSATLETGLVVQVPFFINVGDTLKVDTREGKYLGRA